MQGLVLVTAISLAMLVRDEAEGIEATLERIIPVIDSWTVIDTGSTDDTPELVKRSLAGKPGRLLHRPWVNFGHNRTELLREASRVPGYVLMLDADHTLHVEGDKPDLTADSYLIRIRGTLEWRLPLLTRAGHPFEYRGVAHSYLASDMPTHAENLDWLSIDGGGGVTREKLERDRKLLERSFLENPDDPRTVFYLAQTYRDLDLISQAVRFYRLRADMGGWDEETYFARYQLGVLLSEHISFAEGAGELLRAWQERPTRVEALRALANVANAVADKAAYPTDALFVTPAAYAQPRLTPDQVSAVIVTRGNVDLSPILATLPYDDVIVWDNSKREDLKILGRYEALKEAKHDVVYFQDDDVIFTAHNRLLAAYEPGVVVANMDDPWVQSCGYHDMVMVGAGALADKNLFWPVIDRYLEHHPCDEEFMLEADFAVGTLVPGKKIDLGFLAREFADDPDRLYQQPGQTERKNLVRAKARAVRDREPVPA